jgi:ABC-2 type transport system permease protein
MIDIGGQPAAVVGSLAVQRPGGWLLLRSDHALGSAAAVHPCGMGLAGRIYWVVPLGSLSGFPQWLLGLEPFIRIAWVGAAISAQCRCCGCWRSMRR